MGKSYINKEILHIALPAIVSNITTPLLGLVDTAITGHLGAAVYMSAIAVGGTMFSMVYWVMNFLRLSSSGLTAQAFGAGDFEATRRILVRGMRMALGISLALLLASPWLCDILLSVIGADAGATGLARQYFMIVIFGAPAVLSVYVLSGWMLGMQDSRAPMWMALTTNVVNIAVSLVLVYGFSMKIEGVAIGTVVAQWAGFAVGVALLRRKVRRGGNVGAAPDMGILRFLRMNADIMLRTACLVAVTVWFTHVGASYGSVVLAANSILMQLFIMFSYFMDGFAFAAEALSGKYYGARDTDGLLMAVRRILLWGVGVVALFTAFYLLCGRWIIDILTDDFAVRASARDYILWAVGIPAAGVLAFVWDGVFIGLVWMRGMLAAMLAALGVFFAVYLSAEPSMGNHGLWLAFTLYLLTRGLVQTGIYLARRPRSHIRASR